MEKGAFGRGQALLQSALIRYPSSDLPVGCVGRGLGSSRLWVVMGPRAREHKTSFGPGSSWVPDVRQPGQVWKFPKTPREQPWLCLLRPKAAVLVLLQGSGRRTQYTAGFLRPGPPPGTISLALDGHFPRVEHLICRWVRGKLDSLWEGVFFHGRLPGTGWVHCSPSPSFPSSQRHEAKLPTKTPLWTF